MMKNPRTTLTCFGVLFILAFSLISLSCSSAPLKRYYTLANSEGRKMGGGAICNRSIAIASVEAPPPYDSDKIIFRSDKYEVKYYNYRFWAGTPYEIVRRLLLEKLMQKELFSAAENYVNSSIDHLAMYVTISAIEEVDGKGGWDAHLAMSFLLKETRKDEVIWQYDFDKTRKTEKRNLASLVEALSQIYNSETDKMLVSLAHFIETYEQCHEKPPAPEAQETPAPQSQPAQPEGQQ